MPMSMTVQKSTTTKKPISLRRLLCGGVVLVLPLLTGGCQQEPQPTDTIVRVEEANPVTLVVAPFSEGSGGMPVYPGTIQPYREADLGFPQAGRLLTRLVGIGQTVASGAILAQQDSESFRHQHKSAEATVTAQNAGLHLAMRDAHRAQQLLSEHFVSPAFFEKTKAQADIAQAGVAKAIAERAVFNKTVQDAELHAPFGGVVVATFAEAGQSLASGQPVLRIAEKAHSDAVFSVPEQDRAHWSVGASVGVIALAEAAPKLRAAKVSEVSPEADPVTRSFRVKVGLSPADAAMLPLGASVKVGQRLTLDHTHAMRYRVPMGAIYQLKGETIVWALTANRRVTPKPVRLVGYHPTGVVVEARFEPNAFVVAAGAHLLQEGQLVRPELWLQWSSANAGWEADPQWASSNSAPISLER